MNHILLSYIASVLFMVSTDAQDGCLVGRVCPSITDKVTCLSSRDNRAGHLNQPCAWCDGPSCTTNNDNKCEPVGWLFNRDNLVEPDEFTIASIGLTPRVCPLIVDATTCLSSKDDRTGFLDQPCVWCAGGACTEGIGNRCEPVGWLFEHQNQLNPQKYKVAVACTPLTGDCLVRRACWDIQDLSTCLSSKDNRDFHLDEPCVWCDAGPCHESNDNRCEPVEWLFGNNKQLNPGEYEIASSGLIPRVCPLINDRSICLSSRDNRANHLDEPCVWCDAGPCHESNDNRCEPVEWLFGNNKQLNPGEYEIASSGLIPRVCPLINDRSICLSSRDNRANHLDEPCVWCASGACTTNNDNKCEPVGWLFNRDNLVEPDEFTIASIGLTPRTCPLIVDATTCLSSKDDRTGFLDQPCVWCAGGACTEGIGNRCEPVGWLFEHQNQLNPQKYKVAVACTPLTGDCLVRRACWDIQDLSTCLSSKDNRDFHLDEPCVWCASGACTTNNDNKCEPASWLFEQTTQLNSDDYEVAVSGYSGIIHTNGVTCSDINECENMPCGNNGECQNLEGSYQCKCNNGYQFDGRTCIDINECQGTNECGDYPTRCINTDGGYYCEENCVVHCEGNCQEIMQ
eukprot:559204_1